MIRKILQIEQSSKTKKVKIIYTLKPKHFSENLNFWWIISKSLKKISTHESCWICGWEFWGWLAMGSAKVIRLEESAFVTNEHHTLNVCFSKNTQGGEVLIIGQSLNDTQWSKQRSHKYMRACNKIMTNSYIQKTETWVEYSRAQVFCPKDLDFTLPCHRNLSWTEFRSFAQKIWTLPYTPSLFLLLIS